jgi:hypothetical protein
MLRTRFGVALFALGCAEPTASLPRQAIIAVSEKEPLTNSFSIGADRTIYVRLAQPRDGSGEPTHVFVRRMFASADSAAAPRMVIDLRSISGSDARFVVPLIRGIVTRDRFARSGGLSLVVGAESFSPRQNLSGLLAQYARPTVVEGNIGF